MPQTLTMGAVLTAEVLAERLADTATQALIDEARLSPKPGLVDSRSCGAHQDLNLDLMVRSAHSLTPTFYALALHSWQRPADIALRQEVGRLGRAGEAQMMAETGGVNTHRGAIWAMGLLVSAVAMQPESLLPQHVAQRAAKIAALPDAFSPKKFSKGSHAVQRYQVPGAREEAQSGFPHIIDCALPQLHLSRSRGARESEAQVDA